jgi:hypothetical protein
MGIRYFGWHLVLKYHSGLHSYIQIVLDFSDISSLGYAYQYAIKIKKTLSSIISGILVLKIHHSRRMLNVALTHRKKDISRRFNLKKTIPSYRKKRVMGSQIMTLKFGVSSTKSPSITLINITQKSHFQSKLKKKKWNLAQTLIHSRIRESESMMDNQMLPSQPRISNQNNHRILRRGEPIPFTDVGEGDSTKFHC